MAEMMNRESGVATTGKRVIGDISVIVPTLGRPILARCLQSIVGGTALPARVVLVDQGEDRKTVDQLRVLDSSGCEAVYFQSDERSPASARNAGIQQVEGGFVVAIDDDCFAAADWLEMVERRLRQDPGAIITGRLEPVGNGVPPTVVTSPVPCIHRRPSLRIHSPLASANMAFALSTAMMIGPFDGGVSPAEDNDWAYRALRMGIPIVYAPEVVVYHQHWRTEAQLRATYRAYGWSQGAFYGKHLRNGDWSMVLRAGISLWRGVRSLVYGVVRNDTALKVNAMGRLERLVPGMVAGMRGLASRPAKDRTSGI
jgi:glycosyltransferase involved in cell wall biosynthesis